VDLVRIAPQRGLERFGRRDGVRGALVEVRGADGVARALPIGRRVAIGLARLVRARRPREISAELELRCDRGEASGRARDERIERARSERVVTRDDREQERTRGVLRVERGLRGAAELARALEELARARRIAARRRELRRLSYALGCDERRDLGVH
jgi:hypothetical protein